MPTMFAQVAHLVICESSGSAADFGALTEHVAERLRVFPAYRRRLAEMPFGVARQSSGVPSRTATSPCAERLPAVIDNTLRSLVI